MERAALILYLIVLTLSPLLFGSVHTYAYTGMSLGVLVGSLLLVVKNIRKDPKNKGHKVQFPNTSLNFAFIILLTFLVFQVIPLPDSLLGFISPEAMVVGQKSLPASSALISESPARDWFSLSPYYYPVRMSIIRWTVYILFFLGLTQVLSSQRRIELTIFLILITACFEALYGLAETYSASGHIWWFKKMSQGLDVSGTYINRNHFAGLMEMCLVLAAGYAAALAIRRKRRGPISAHKTRLRVRISRYLSGEQRFDKRTSLIFLGVVIGIGLIFSASRGGMLSGAGAMLCMGLFFIFRKDHRRKGFIILFLFVIISVYALHIGVEYPIGRFKYFDESLEARSRYTQKTMDIFDDYRITGVGLGNFQHAYPGYQAVEDKKRFFRHAHNDWAQFLADAGITGFCLLLAGMFFYVYRTIRLLRKRTDPFAICLGVTPLAVITAMAIHSYSDFNLHIPANCLMLAAIMAIGYSALYMENHHGRNKTMYRYHTIPLKYKGMLALLLVLGLIIWNGFWTIRHFMAEAYCNTVHNSTLNRDQSPPLREIRKAIAWDRWNAGYWYKLTQELMKIRNAEMGSLEADDEAIHKRRLDIIRALEETVRLDPFSAEYHLRLGWEYTFLWQDPDYHQKWLPAADISMGRAAYFAGVKNPSLHMELGNYWVMRSKTIYPTMTERQTAWAKACWHYKKAQEIDGSEKMLQIITKHIWNFYPDMDIVSEAVNASFLEREGKILGK